jgi:hypothetical protein
MKEATVEQFSEDPMRLLSEAQRDYIVVTRDGKPFAIVVGVANKDQEDFRLEACPEFWRMIEDRRRSATVRLADVETELLATD